MLLELIRDKTLIDDKEEKTWWFIRDINWWQRSENVVVWITNYREVI